MSCIQLLHNRDYTCQNPARKYVQKVVLIRKSDVLNYTTFLQETNGGKYGIFINFDFKTNDIFINKRFVLKYNANSSVVLGSFQKSVKNNLTQYKHQLQIAVFDVAQATKVVLRSLDKADYFALLEYQNGFVEVYGFHNGLITANYNYDPANNSGGGLITLESVENEYTMPYILCDNKGTPIKNFVANINNISLETIFRWMIGARLRTWTIITSVLILLLIRIFI